MDADYRREVARRVELSPFPVAPFPVDGSIRRSDVDLALGAPGYSELLEAMFAEHDADRNGVVTSDEYADPVLE